MALAARPALPPEVPVPRRAGLKRGVEAGECVARPSRRAARRHHSEFRPAPGEGATQGRRSSPAFEGGVVAARRPSRGPLRSTGPTRPPHRARPAKLATAVTGESRETPPAAGRHESPRAPRARNYCRRRNDGMAACDADRSESGWRNVVTLKTSLSKFPALLRHVNVVVVRAEQSSADVFPRAFGARPGAEELDRVTIRLGPPPVTLQRFVEPPAQVVHRLGLRDDLPRGQVIGFGRAPAGVVPAPLPLIDPDIAHCVNVGGAPELVMPENSGFKKNAHTSSIVEARFDREP